MARPMPGPRGEVQAVFDLLADRPLGGQPCRSRADSSFDSLDRWFGKDCFAIFHNEGCSACTKGGGRRVQAAHKPPAPMLAMGSFSTRWAVRVMYGLARTAAEDRTCRFGRFVPTGDIIRSPLRRATAMLGEFCLKSMSQLGQSRPCRNDRLWRAPCKGGAFQWVQVPPGNRSSRKQSEQSWR
jgi:hypothetical protein